MEFKLTLVFLFCLVAINISTVESGRKTGRKEKSYDINDEEEDDDDDSYRYDVCSISQKVFKENICEICCKENKFVIDQDESKQINSCVCSKIAQKKPNRRDEYKEEDEEEEENDSKFEACAMTVMELGYFDEMHCKYCCQSNDGAINTNASRRDQQCYCKATKRNKDRDSDDYKYSEGWYNWKTSEPKQPETDKKQFHTYMFGIKQTHTYSR